MKSTVWKSVQHTPFRFAFYRFLRWSPFRRGMTLPRWVRVPTHLRESFFQKKSGPNPEDIRFRLIFPRWDAIVIILSIFLLTYTYIEAKANYHRGSILVLRFVFFYSSLPGIHGHTYAIVLPTAISCLRPDSSSRHTAQAATMASKALTPLSDPWLQCAPSRRLCGCSGLLRKAKPPGSPRLIRDCFCFSVS